MFEIAEARIPIMLDKERILTFNCNTMVAYEKETGKFFLDAVSKLYEALQPQIEKAKKEGKDNDNSKLRISGLEIARHLSMVEFRALIWAAVQEYDDKDNPSWPLTLNQVGRCINMKNVGTIFSKFLEGQSVNAPTEKELGESPALQEQNLAGNAASGKLGSNTHDAGGTPSIALPVGAFD